MQDQISFDVFRDQWLESLRSSSSSRNDIGQQFAQKIFAQWRNLSELSDDLIVESHNLLGVDLAYHEQGDISEDGNSGDTWYVVSAKMGKAVDGKSVEREALHFLELLGNQKPKDSSPELLEQLHQFMSKKRSDDGSNHISYVVATELPADDALRQFLENIRIKGREQLGAMFDVTAISIETIYLNTLDDTSAAELVGVRVPIKANVKLSGNNLLIGSVVLPDLYAFLSAYRDCTEDLDQLYEKNVRQYLGGRRRVNKGIQNTLLNSPEQFGLYNNGITIVVSNFAEEKEGNYELVQPYIVNGCQTTRSIWEVFRQQIETEQKKNPKEVQEWLEKTKNGVVVVKIVRIGEENENLLDNITRYTNSQNAVSEKDFVTLDDDFRRWKREMGEKFDVFLEIQRGGWDSRVALQNQNPLIHQFKVYANAFDLLKVYGSGWLHEAGTAFGRNAAFVPGGKIYKQIVDRGGLPFGVDDLYAAHCLKSAGDRFGFGRSSLKTSRRQTRYLFYLIATDLLRDVMIRANMPTSVSDITNAYLKLFQNGHEDAASELLDASIGVIDEYFTQGEEDSVFTEPAFTERFNQDLNGLLKWERLGKGEDTPAFNNIMAINKRTMGRGTPSPRQLIEDAIR